MWRVMKAWALQSGTREIECLLSCLLILCVFANFTLSLVPQVLHQQNWKGVDHCIYLPEFQCVLKYIMHKNYQRACYCHQPVHASTSILALGWLLWILFNCLMAFPFLQSHTNSHNLCWLSFHNAGSLFFRTDHVQWPDMEGAKKVHPDNTKELWFRKEELRWAHTGGGLSPCPGNGGGEWWVSSSRTGAGDCGPVIHWTGTYSVVTCLSCAQHYVGLCDITEHLTVALPSWSSRIKHKKGIKDIIDFKPWSPVWLPRH